MSANWQSSNALTQDRVAELGVLDRAIDEDRLGQVGVGPVEIAEARAFERGAGGRFGHGLLVAAKDVPHWHGLTEIWTDLRRLGAVLIPASDSGSTLGVHLGLISR
jgi:hypothetical protein